MWYRRDGAENGGAMHGGKRVGSFLVAAAIVLSSVGAAAAATIVYDWTNGIPGAGDPYGGFSVRNDGGIWTVTTGGAAQTIEFFKPGESGSGTIPNATSGAEGAVAANFDFTSAFTATVPFTLVSLPTPATPPDANGAVNAAIIHAKDDLSGLSHGSGIVGGRLGLANDSGAPGLPSSGQYAFAFNEATQGLSSASPSADASGLLQVGRDASNLLTLSESGDGGVTWTVLYSATDANPLNLRLGAASVNLAGGQRSLDAIDVLFGPLTIAVADVSTIVPAQSNGPGPGPGPVPEPATIVLAAASLALAARRR
jgi:hypothetical protein